MGYYTLKIWGPPGTGKTSTQISILKGEIESGIHPNEIAYLSFTRAAAYEGRDRILEAFPEFRREDFDKVGTIHSLCFRLLGVSSHNIFTSKHLEEFARLYRYKFSFLQEADSFSQVFTDRQIDTDADLMEFFADWQKNKMLFDFDQAYLEFVRTYRSLPEHFNKSRLKTYLERREKFKQENNLWDFADLVLGCLKKEKFPRIKVLAVDEAQDLSKLLMAFIEKLSQIAERTYISSDAYQAIYGWASADPLLVLNFPCDEEFTLKQSYRCPKAVHDLARKIVERKFKHRYPDDDFYPRFDAQGEIIRAYPKFSNLTDKTFYLFRTRYLLNLKAEELMLKGVPFVTRRGKWSPLDPRSGKVDCVMNLYLLVNDEPVTLYDLARIIDYVPARGWLKHGSKTQIKEIALKNPATQVKRKDLPDYGFTPRFVSALDEAYFLEVLNPKDFPDPVKNYFRKVIDKYGIEAIKNPKLELGTYHSVKGLEADTVILDLNLTRSPWENLMSGNEEEDRLMYVGVTRSKNKLVIVPPDRSHYYPL